MIRQCVIWIKKVFFILTSGVPSGNRKDLQALASVGPTGTSLDPQAVLRLDNQLYIILILFPVKTTS